MQLLHYIASVRNKAAHESADAELAGVDSSFFEKACESALTELRGIMPDGAAPDTAGGASDRRPVRSPPREPEHAEGEIPRVTPDSTRPPPGRSHAVPPSPRRPPSAPNRSIRRAALIPGAHLVYPVWLLLQSLRPGAGPVAGLCSYVLSLTAAARAVRAGSSAWLYAAVALLAAGWLYGAVSGWRGRREEQLPLMFYLAPGVNAIYILLLLIRRADKWRFLSSLTLLGSAAVGLYLLVRHAEYLAGAAVLAAGYLVGIVMSTLEHFRAATPEEDTAETRRER